MEISRRSLIKTGSIMAAGVAARDVLFVESAEAAPAKHIMPPLPKTENRDGIPYRALGKTGEMVSIVGLGGFHIGKQKDEDASIRIIHAAIDGGINFLDNCWDYNDGISEVRMGKALQKGRRDKVFLMSKIDGRSQASAARQIDESLLRLKTDHIDLMQFHEIIRFEDPDLIFAKGGALEAVLKAQKAGKIRFIGFTGHKDPQIHLRMFEIAKQHSFHFDAVQHPVNVMDAHFRSFLHNVVPVSAKAGTATLAMKTFGDPFIIEHIKKSGDATPTELLHFGMSQPVSTVITGIDSLKVLEQAINAARTFKPMSKTAQEALLVKTKEAASQGFYERFKTTAQFDGTAKNPEWLGLAS